MRIPKVLLSIANGVCARAPRARASNAPKVAGHLQDRFVVHHNEKWIPLDEASRIMYDELAGTKWRAMADKEATLEERLNYLAAHLVRNAPIEGRSPPSMEHRPIPSGDFESGIVKGGGRYFQRDYQSYLTFLDLRIKEADLQDALKKMKA
ncbi:MAG TPA: hypothetical protein VKF40_25045 [Burkholderiales bacterium]|nr:hypothetical protein [Burkholderiales bacterium]